MFICELLVSFQLIPVLWCQHHCLNSKAFEDCILQTFDSPINFGNILKLTFCSFSLQICILTFQHKSYLKWNYIPQKHLLPPYDSLEKQWGLRKTYHTHRITIISSKKLQQSFYKHGDLSNRIKLDVTNFLFVPLVLHLSSTLCGIMK